MVVLESTGAMIRRTIAHAVYLRQGESAFLQYLRQAERDQWLNKQALEHLRIEKLRRLLYHCAANVPYYKQLFETIGFRPDMLRRVEDLCRVPPVTKAVLQTQAQALLATGINPARLFPKKSPGSTGAPSTIFVDADRAARGWAYNTRHNRWAGYEWGARVAQLWGGSAPRAINNQDGWARRGSVLRHVVLAQDLVLHIDPFDVVEEHLGRFAEDFVRFRPQVVLGYSTSVWLLARYFDASPHLRVPRPNAVICGGEMLSPDAACLIERVFQRRVSLRYGTRELDIIASHCPHGGFHTNDDNLIVETVGESDDAGSVLVTDLNNMAMPLIRYDTGDMARRTDDDACTCGRRFGTLGNLEGRRTSLLRTADGRSVRGHRFVRWFTLNPGVSSYLVHQRTAKLIEVSVVMENGEGSHLLQPLVDDMKGVFGADCQVHIRLVPCISKVGTGKLECVRSDLPQPMVHKEWSAR
jgi:phenylacetate-CoA ligase